MKLEDVYFYANACIDYNEFIQYIARKIDNVPETVQHDNEYVLVNKKRLT